MGIARLAFACVAIALVSRPALASFRLEIGGTPATAFTATCEAVGSADEGTYSFSGLVPRRYDIDAEAVACQVRKEDLAGRLTVRLVAGGRVVAAETTAVFRNIVEVRSAGPWGEARARRSKRGSGPFDPAPGLEGKSVPPLTGPIVPPLPGQKWILPPLIPTP
jgi:hypothetical protein